MNAIGYAQFQLSGGTRRLLRWVVVFVVLTALGLAAWSRTSGGFAMAASAARFPLTLALCILLIFVVNMRIGGAIKRDGMLDMSRSHRLMPQTAAAAVLGYIVGSSLPVLSAAGVVVLAGVVCTLGAGGNPATWLMVSGILGVFAAMSWCLTAAANFAGKAPRGQKQKGGIGWLPWVIIGPSLGTGGALLMLVPWLAVVLGPLIGQTVFGIRRVDQITWAHGASGALQAAFAGIFFIAACRRYRRDDLPAFNALLWLAILALIVIGSIVGIARFEEFRPGFFDSALLVHNVAVPATLTLLLLLVAGPLSAAEAEATMWRYRRNVEDPLAAESRPRLHSAPALILFVLLCAPLAVFTPDTLGVMDAWDTPLPSVFDLFEPSVWLRTWLITVAAFVCGALLIWSVVRIAHRAGGGRFLVLAILILWLAPVVAAGVWAFRQDGHLDRMLTPIAAFSTPGAIWTAWCGTAPAGTGGLERAHIMAAPAPALWTGVAFQAFVALAAIVLAWRAPDRAAKPAERE